MHTLEQLRAGALSGVRRLQMRGGLTEFPREIFDLADSLEILDLSGNALSSLPENRTPTAADWKKLAAAPSGGLPPAASISVG